VKEEGGEMNNIRIHQTQWWKKERGGTTGDVPTVERKGKETKKLWCEKRGGWKKKGGLTLR